MGNALCHSVFVTKYFIPRSLIWYLDWFASIEWIFKVHHSITSSSSSVDDLEGLTFITNCPNFVDTPTNDQYVMFMRTSGENASESVGQIFRGAIRVIQNIWDTIMFIVLGRRRQDDERPVHQSYSVLNEDEWNGIPSQSEIQQSEMV